MEWRGTIAAAGLVALLWSGGARADAVAPTPPPAAPSAAPSPYPAIFVVRHDHWTDIDERDYSRFIAEIGESGCNTVDLCLHSPRNPFHGTDPPGVYFASDCADLAYNLRFYFAWKRGLPFGYVSQVRMRGAGRDFRYGFSGNAVEARLTVPSGKVSGYEIWDEIRDNVSSGTFRIHPTLEEPEVPDLYSPAIDVRSIRPGTAIYDPNGHVATVYKVETDGRIRYMDAHPDSSLTRGFYDLRFVRAYPGMGAGFKNWRPLKLVGARKLADGTYSGGRAVPASNAEIANFSTEQFYGNGPKPDEDRDWRDGTFTLNGQPLDWYDYVRAKLAGGKLEFDPLREVSDMIDSNCVDLHDRVDAVDLAAKSGLVNQPEPDRLPENIYGTDGDWETYSTPSRDARLKTAFKELRDAVERYVKLWRAKDPKLHFKGNDLIAELIALYDRKAAQCTIVYVRSDGTPFALGYEQIRARLFALSFDPYQCVERRWGAGDPAEFAPCPDTTLKAAWYEAEQGLRNQIDRTYEAQMGFSLEELRAPGPDRGVATAPDIDVRGFLERQRAPAKTASSQ
ncbi:MAG: hypothetical protein JO261_14105 [Alphaproteobacteria bacterium]|nr:hypothetical protein [Alphaproteobacteria bacterium]MBV9694827.1 hypothetical protein [Alphaproteobacteria bacterium]